ncbi:MAG TPA: lanthionine synthetase LanC family protein, partial [Blastocatellia bacterium]|nr:lanthionine synthetase LanC family protein [Blastocatellia bacterium]
MRSFKAVLALLTLLCPTLSAGEPSYRKAAVEAARWIQASAIATDQGTAWPADPRDAKSVNHTLYAGTSGVVLFFIEAWRSTGDQSFLKDARAGGDHLLVALAAEKDLGLYTGVAGIGFALTEAFKATGDVKYKEGAVRCARLVEQRAQKAGKGIEWNETTDIISGGAGIGLFLLYAARELKEPNLRELAIQGAYRLI